MDWDDAPCGLLSLLPDGWIDQVNPTFLQWTGYRREELVGRKDELLAALKIPHAGSGGTVSLVERQLAVRDRPHAGGGSAPRLHRARPP